MAGCLDEFCVMRGVVPPGTVVPLHRHADAEDFFILSGTQQVLIQEGDGLMSVSYTHLTLPTKRIV